MEATNSDLTLVMPAFNEEDRISEALRRALALEFIDKIVVVDDGSLDGTADVVLALNDERIELVRLLQNCGKGAAVRVGLRHVSTPYVGIHDADLEYDPRDFLKLLGPLRDGRADVVYGSRFIGGDEHRVLYFWHSIGNKFLTLASNAVTNLNLTDMETGSKVFRTEALEGITLREDRFGFEPEVTARIAQRRLRVFEVGISYSGRTYAQGKKIGWRDGFRALYVIGRSSLRK